MYSPGGGGGDCSRGMGLGEGFERWWRGGLFFMKGSGENKVGWILIGAFFVENPQTGFLSFSVCFSMAWRSYEKKNEKRRRTKQKKKKKKIGLNRLHVDCSWSRT